MPKSEKPISASAVLKLFQNGEIWRTEDVEVILAAARRDGAEEQREKDARIAEDFSGEGAFYSRHTCERVAAAIRRGEVEVRLRVPYPNAPSTVGEAS